MRGEDVVPLALRSAVSEAAHPDAGTGGVTEVTVGRGPLSAEEVLVVARLGAPVVLAERAPEDAAADVPVNGIGDSAASQIPLELRGQAQRNLVRSHAAGTGAEVEREVVRAMMLLRLAALASGRTGVRRGTARAYAAMLSAGIVPIVREHGSLGSPGDGVPLAHCAVALMGEGPARDASGRESLAAVLLAEAGIEPVTLADGEGVALVDGADGTLGMLVLALADLRMLVSTADVVAAISVEGLLGSDDAFAAARRGSRPPCGEAASAANIRTLLDGSPLVAVGHAGTDGCDASLSCAAVVAGAARDTLDHAAGVAERALAAASSDGPGAHGAPLAYVLDFLAIVAADLASVSERRTDRLLDGVRSRNLPPFLAGDPVAHSGCMVAQHTQAALVAELRRSAMPASVDSIAGAGIRCGHVSMGWAAARKLRRAVDALASVLAIELLAAARGVRMRAPLEPAVATGAVIDVLEERVRVLRPDHSLAPDIDAAADFVRGGHARAAAEGVVGPLA